MTHASAVNTAQIAEEVSFSATEADLLGTRALTNAHEAFEYIGSVLEFSTECSVIATDPEGVILLWNEGARLLYGYDPSEIIGRHKSLLHTEQDVDAGLPRVMMDEALAHGKWSGAVERVRRDRSTFTARVVMIPRRESRGRLVGFLLMSSDISDEVRMAAELERSRGYTLAVLASAPDPMVIVNDSGVIKLVNAATEAMFGYRSEELVGGRVEVLLPPRYRDRASGHRSGFFSQPLTRPMGAGLELWGARKDGSEFPVEISLSPLETGEGSYAIAAIRDVTDRKRHEQDLHRANAELAAANRAKDRFLANMSHELRTPLNAILGFTGTLLMELPGALNDEQTKQLSTVQTGARHLLSLINDLLDLARIESRAVRPRVESVDCRELLEEVAAGLRPLADQKGLELEVIVPASPCEIQTDRRALNQILINLANNAIKFTDRGVVRLELSQHPHDQGRLTRFTVADTGRGIKPADRTRLFAAFEQIESSIDAPNEGTGLGLHICQTLAAFIGAAITLESEFANGSAFTLELAG